MPFWTYIIRCADASYYVGHTDNLENRVAEHNWGGVTVYTRKRRPLKLVWSEEFPSREEALACELQLKGWSRAKEEALMKGNWTRLQELARHL